LTTVVDAKPAGGIHARFHLTRHQAGGPVFRLDVDAALPGRGITALFGRSGSGKTTFLRCVAGLEKAPGGRLLVGGELWQDGNRFLPVHRRPLGYVFQESSLFPHLSAGGNLAYASRRSGADSAILYERVVQLMGIGPLLDRLPDHLSGGERQRVAIARALLIQPRLLAMDEPLASLDSPHRLEILPYIERLREDFDIPVLYVSHSIDEVARLADHILVLEAGRVAAQGPLTDVLSRVDLPLALGEETGVVLQGHVVERDSRWQLARVSLDGGDIWVRDRGDARGQAVRLRVLARDVSLALTSREDTSILNRLPVTVEEIADDRDAAMSVVRLALGADRLLARVTCRSVHHLALAAGKRVWAQVKSVAVVR